MGLVLGAGGLVGLAYHVGVLRALEEESGVPSGSAHLVVGTSAGSVVGAYVRRGWPLEALWDEIVENGGRGLAESVLVGSQDVDHEELGGGEEVDGRALEILSPAFGSVLDLARRSIGSAFVLHRALLRFPAPQAPGPLRRAFPGGMFVMADGERRLSEELAGPWPSEHLWLCALDIVSGRRVVLHAGDPHGSSLALAVRASCAIPGVYPPVRMGRQMLVDGGARSTTNLDLMARTGCDTIIGVAPMAFDSTDPPGPVGLLARRLPQAMLAAEVALARSRGARVLLVRPSAAEVRLHGFNLMRSEGLDLVATSSYVATKRVARTAPFREGLQAMSAA